MYQSPFWFWTFEHVWISRSNESIVTNSGRIINGTGKIDDCRDGIIGCVGEDVGNRGLGTLFKLAGNKGKILLDSYITDGKDRMIRIHYKFIN